MASSRKNKLPISRVKTIMKSSPDVENISAESVHLVARAAELFIQYLAKESHSRNQDKSQLQYKDIASVVNEDQELEFLRELIPKKITIKEYKEIMKNKKEHWVLPPDPKEAFEGGKYSKYMAHLLGLDEKVEEARPSTSASALASTSPSTSAGPSTSTSASTSAGPSTSASTSAGPSTSTSAGPSTSASTSAEQTEDLDESEEAEETEEEEEAEMVEMEDSEAEEDEEGAEAEEEEEAEAEEEGAEAGDEEGAEEFEQRKPSGKSFPK